MEFRTKISMLPFDRRIGYDTPGLSLGSCFAENISARMRALKFPVASNPFGVLFNPASIATAIEILDAGRTFDRSALAECSGVWSSFHFHGGFSSADPDEALGKMNEAVQQGSAALRDCDYLVITFGTAWIYELSENMGGCAAGEVVANCHKFPATAFRRRRLSVDEIVTRYETLLQGPLAGKHIILTVSPVRHIKDGLAGNSASKATLVLAAQQLAERHHNIDYFPSFEIVNDDLRDYRFYAADMLHPSDVAVDYIWEVFSANAVSPEALQAAGEIGKLVAAAQHRPLNPDTAQYREFVRAMREKAARLQEKYPQIDLTAELEFFAG